MRTNKKTLWIITAGLIIIIGTGCKNGLSNETNKSEAESGIKSLNNAMDKKSNSASTTEISKKEEIKEKVFALENRISRTEKQLKLYQDALPQFINFNSENQKLKFSYSKKWSCQEKTINETVICFPVERLSEYLENNIVYFPELIIDFSNCDIENIPTQNSVQKVNREGVGVFYQFNKKINNCSVLITSETKEVDSELKLNEIIR